jgi:hypothetical protein
MHLWKAGDVAKVDEYLESQLLQRNPVFHRLLQALIELAQQGSDERSLLESLSNHVVARPAQIKPGGSLFPETPPSDEEPPFELRPEPVNRRLPLNRDV